MSGRNRKPGRSGNGRSGRRSGKSIKRPPELADDGAETQEPSSESQDNSPAGAYRVGYGKPPPETRFKPGRSGNPAGRPKKSKNIRTVMREALTEPVGVRGRRGGVKKHPSIIAAIKVHLQNALQGDLPSLRALLPLLPLIDDAQLPAAPVDALAGRNVHEMLQRYLAARPDLLADKTDADGGNA